MKRYDIIIVGAGPAGANFARLVDSEKYKVLIIDGSEGKDKVCGGLISPDAQDILAGYDICLPKDILVSPQLFSVRTIDLTNNIVKHYRRSYLNIDRKKLDDLFRSLIPHTVDKISGRCKHISHFNKEYEIELINGEKYTCRYIIGADGASSKVRADIFKQKKLDKYIAIQQQFPAGNTNPFYSCIFDNYTSPACSWIFFKDDKMIFGGAFDAKSCRAAFEKQKQKLQEQGFVENGAFDHPQKTEACLVSRPKIFKGIFTGENGAFLLGEAAGFISPSSFEGISYALNSGDALADAFNKYSLDRSAAIHRFYNKKTFKLRTKIMLRCVKRPFMYNKLLRRLVMKSGLTSIKIKNNK